MRKITVFLFILCIVILFLAGCTGTQTATPTMVKTPTPEIIYVTVLATPTPLTTIISVTSAAPVEVTTAALDETEQMDAEFLEYIDDNHVIEAMNTLAGATPGSYSISTGYNAGPKNEALRLNNLVHDAPKPGSEQMKEFRTAMMDALSMMDGSTAGFTRYRDSLQRVILDYNAVISEMHSEGSASVDAEHLMGHGNDVRSFNVTETGLKTFTIHHTGEHNFAITLKNEDGKYIALLANAIGDYSGKTSERLVIGKYNLDITADGDWTIGIASG